MRRIRLTAVGIAAAATIACSSGSTEPKSAAVVQPATRAGGIDVKGMDRSVSPGDDFFRFANGTWLKTTDIPADRGAYGIGAELSDRALQRSRELIDALAAPGTARTADERRIADYVAAYTDEATIEAKGLTPLQPFLTTIAAIHDPKSFAAWVCGTLRTDVDALNNTNFYTDHLFGVWISPALDDPNHYAPYLLQGGLGMPDRDYYLEPSKEMQDIRTRYRAHIATVLRLAGVADPDNVAERVYALEEKIARVHVTRTNSVDVQKANNPWPRAEFPKRAPGLDWNPRPSMPIALADARSPGLSPLRRGDGSGLDPLSAT